MAMTINRIDMGDAWKERLRAIASTTPDLRVGFLDNATYANGESVAYIAYINNFGRGDNPERPFMKQTLDENIDKWLNGIESNVRNNLTPENIRRAFEMAGQVASADVKEKILNWDSPNPSNKESTIAKKRSRGLSGGNLEAINPTQVLVDTSTMVKAVDYEVV